MSVRCIAKYAFYAFCGVLLLNGTADAQQKWRWNALPAGAQVWLCLDDNEPVLVGYFENEAGKLIGLGVAEGAEMSRVGNTVLAAKFNTVYQFGSDSAAGLSVGRVTTQACKSITWQVDNLLNKLKAE